MATATETYTPRLKDLYEGEIRDRLKDELGLDSIMQVPRIEKITLGADGKPKGTEPLDVE